MAGKAPGRAHRRGMSLVEVIEAFPDDATAERWFESVYWPNGPRCGGDNVVEVRHPSMTHRCRACPKRPMFSLRTGTVMRSSKLGYRVWALATYLHVASLKGVSSMKLHRDLGITQKHAWHLGHRLREAWGDREREAFEGGVEVDETFVGGKRKNMRAGKRRELRERYGSGAGGKAVVAGARGRDDGKVRARVVESTDRKTLHGFVAEAASEDATVYTDGARAYGGIPQRHEAVDHNAGEYVRGMAHTNGIESFWAQLKRGYQGTFHHLSQRHLDRYVREFAGRHNARELDTIDAMGELAKGMTGRRCRMSDLVPGTTQPRRGRPKAPMETVETIEDTLTLDDQRDQESLVEVEVKRAA